MNLANLQRMLEIFPGDELADKLEAGCFTRKGMHLDQAIATMERIGHFAVDIAVAYVAAGRRDKVIERTEVTSRFSDPKERRVAIPRQPRTASSDIGSRSPQPGCAPRGGPSR